MKFKLLKTKRSSGPMARPPYKAGVDPNSPGWWKLYDAFDREVCMAFGIGAERDINLISDAMNALYHK